MRAVTYSAYGAIDGLEVADVPSPRPRRGELLVRVTRAALNPKDALFRTGTFRAISGSTFPKQCGLDFAGVVEESDSEAFKVGQRVFGMINEWKQRRGSLSEYLVCKRDEVAALPDGISDDSGAAVALVGVTALQALRDIARIKSGTRLLVNGASGGLGTVAVQIARILGAEVETMSSARNLDLCRRLGAKVAWDYGSSAISEAKPHFDVVFDVFGNQILANVRSWFGPGGIFISAVPTIGRALRDVFTRLASVQERLVIVRQRQSDLEQLAVWLKDGRLEAVVDSRFPMQRVREAFQLLESRRARGKIIVEVA